MISRARQRTMRPLTPGQHRALALVLAIIVGALAVYLRLTVYNGASDMIWPHCAARQWLQSHDPYSPTCFMYSPGGEVWALYPFTTVLALAPFAPISWILATAAIVGLSASVLAYGLIRRGGPGMLFVFMSAPAVEVVRWGQWMYLIPAIALLPALYPLAAVKPHVALPVVLTKFTPRRLLAAAVFGLISLLLIPDWPWRWLSVPTTYGGFVPILTAAGLIFLPLLFFWRDPDARYLLLVALTPQRGFYDAMLAVPALGSAWAAALWTFCTWTLATVAGNLGMNLYTFHIFAAYFPAVILVAIQALRKRAQAAKTSANGATTGGSVLLERQP